MSEHDDGLAASVEDALDLDLEVLVGIPYEAETVASTASSRLHGVARVHILQVRRDEIANRFLPTPSVIDALHQLDVRLRHTG
jgi:hypothetical protein